jgi:hypothetical protein
VSSCEKANIIVIKASPVHLTLSLSFVYLYMLIMILTCALNCRSWMDVVVALGLLSNPPLLVLWLEIYR